MLWWICCAIWIPVKKFSLTRLDSCYSDWIFLKESWVEDINEWTAWHHYRSNNTAGSQHTDLEGVMIFTLHAIQSCWEKNKIRWLCSMLGSWAFLVAAALIWNSLPSTSPLPRCSPSGVTWKRLYYNNLSACSTLVDLVMNSITCLGNFKKSLIDWLIVWLI